MLLTSGLFFFSFFFSTSCVYKYTTSTDYGGQVPGTQASCTCISANKKGTVKESVVPNDLRRVGDPWMLEQQLMHSQEDRQAFRRNS